LGGHADPSALDGKLARDSSGHYLLVRRMGSATHGLPFKSPRLRDAAA